MKAMLLILGPLLVGIVLIMKASIVGNAFCKLGKAIWTTASLGKTDMAYFYQEEKAKSLFRAMGIVLIAWSILMTGIALHAGLR